MMPKMTLRGMLPGLKKLVGAGPGGGPLWGLLGTGAAAWRVAWTGVVWQQRLLSGCWPGAAQGMLGLGAAQNVWQLQQHAVVRESWVPNSRCGGSSPTAWSSNSRGAEAKDTPSLACWSGGCSESCRPQGALTACVPTPPHTQLVIVGAG